MTVWRHQKSRKHKKKQTRKHYLVQPPWSRSVEIFLSLIDKGSVSRKSRKRFGPEKTFITLRSAYSVKLVFSCVVKRNINYYNYKVSCLEAPSFWRYKDNHVTRNVPEKFRDFWETGPRPQLFEGGIAFDWPYSGIGMRKFTSKNHVYESFDVNRIHIRFAASFRNKILSRNRPAFKDGAY